MFINRLFLILFDCVLIFAIHIVLIFRDKHLWMWNEQEPEEIFFMVNGNDSYPNEFPWFAVITKIHLNDRLEGNCGRTIINHRRIVTAT